MIGYAIDCNQFLALIANDTRDILVEILFEFWFDERLSVTYCEYGLNVDLGNVFAKMSHIPLLTELRRFLESFVL